MTKSESEDLESLYHLYGNLDQIEGNLMCSVPLGQECHPRIKIVLGYVRAKAHRISQIATGLRDYK